MVSIDIINTIAAVRLFLLRAIILSLAPDKGWLARDLFLVFPRKDRFPLAGIYGRAQYLASAVLSDGRIHGFRINMLATFLLGGDTSTSRQHALTQVNALDHEAQTGSRDQKMTSSRPRPVTINIDDGRRVSGLLQAPNSAHICYVLAHGAGAGMAHPFMATVADGHAERGIATLRYQFSYMEQGSKRPDAPKLAEATVRAAVAKASHMLPKLGLVAGGKSFGGRMTSQAQAESPLPGVRGLVFLGFPLHAAGRPSEERAKHLFEVGIPMLFLQGTRDALADVHLMEKLAQQLGPRATLKLLSDADHSFHVPARTGRKDAEVRAEALDALAAWIETVV